MGATNIGIKSIGLTKMQAFWSQIIDP